MSKEVSNKITDAKVNQEIHIWWKSCTQHVILRIILIRLRWWRWRWLLLFLENSVQICLDSAAKCQMEALRRYLKDCAHNTPPYHPYYHGESHLNPFAVCRFRLGRLYLLLHLRFLHSNSWPQCLLLSLVVDSVDDKSIQKKDATLRHWQDCEFDCLLQVFRVANIPAFSGEDIQRWLNQCELFQHISTTTTLLVHHICHHLEVPREHGQSWRQRPRHDGLHQVTAGCRSCTRRPQPEVLPSQPPRLASSASRPNCSSVILTLQSRDIECE